MKIIHTRLHHRPSDKIEIPRKDISEMPFWMAWQTRSLERWLRTTVQLERVDYIQLATRMIYRNLSSGKPINYQLSLDEINRPLIRMESEIMKLNYYEKPN